MTPQHLVDAINSIQRKAAEWDYAESRGDHKKPTPSQIFVSSAKWRRVRQEALRLYDRVCHKCGSLDSIQVDHIKPKSKYPDLAYEVSNLQLLCWPCNKVKSNTDDTDYRPNINQSGKRT